MKASVKYRVIHRFKDKYNVRDMCIFFGVSRSGYYAWTKKVDKEDPDKQIGELIRECQKKTKQTYGYRRVQIWLLREFGQSCINLPICLSGSSLSIFFVQA